ncbi:hypothetical protein GCM10011491_30170 [Brucella endophytica]|uniref:Uncharacterized protein n=1 Tax=Brucella endophytica TaxID=1963359 RepID=A0A916SHN6_9HYPH|nr:hypothetical protein [Brucella endophytica]GGA99869.1 hypothetical protein GCM10011491_30170 [Brucella endophytica]
MNTPHHTREIIRALKMLDADAAYELRDRPIAVLSALVNLGYATRQETISINAAGQPQRSYHTSITPAGRQALAGGAE